MTQQNAVVFFFSYCHCHHNNRTMRRVFLSLPLSSSFFFISDFVRQVLHSRFIKFLHCTKLSALFLVYALWQRHFRLGLHGWCSVFELSLLLYARLSRFARISVHSFLLLLLLLFHIDAEQGAFEKMLSHFCT